MKRYIPEITGMALLIITLAGCEQEEITGTVQEELVLNGYLYENESVRDIRISQSAPFTVDDTIFPMVSDASVSISWNGREFPLIPSDSAGYYHCPDTGLHIVSGNRYSIRAEYENEEITAETTVPPKPDSLQLSPTRLEIDPDLSPFEMRQMPMTDIEVTWANPEGDYYYVLVENMEENPGDIELGSGGSGFRPRFRFLSRPFITDRYIIRLFMSVRQYGTHRVRVYHVNREYADLYEHREQDSRNLTEPLSNVENGLGIFTAFSYDEAWFEVLRK